MRDSKSQTIYSSTHTLSPALTTAKASSYNMTYMYINTQLEEHEEDQTLVIHGYKINDQLRRGLRFQTRILYRQRRSEVE
jgi:hypothetical protein